MKCMLFLLALALPAIAMAGVPAPQDVPASAQPAARQPLFQVRYVLLPAPKEASDTPRIDYDGRSAAVVPLPQGHWGYRQLDPFASNPNVEICRQWACEVPGRH
jgi:hypothetical protein